MKTIVTYVDADFAKRVKMLAVQMDLTLQELLTEALNDWVAKHETTQLRAIAGLKGSAKKA